MLTKIDLKREYRHLYQAKRAPAMVDVPSLAFLMIDGRGDPNGNPAFQEAVQAVYAAAYTMKFSLKRGKQSLDYPVMPLEGLWWSADPGGFSPDRKRDWRWTLMIMQPDEVTPDALGAALEAARAKKPELTALSRIRLERFDEGRCAQVLHIGPYAAEQPTIERLHAFVAAAGHRLRGKHHEIYLGDPRRSAPEKLKTILRHPVD